MKEKEYEWELISEGELVGTGTVKAQNQIEAREQALTQLDPDQKKAVLNNEILFNIQEWIEEE